MDDDTHVNPIEEYNNSINILIESYNLQRIEKENEDYTLLNDFFIDIYLLFYKYIKMKKPFIMNESFKKLLLESCDFFYKSTSIFLLNINSYYPPQRDELKCVSANCKYIIADIKFENNKENERVFIKVVDYNEQLNKIIDLLLFDVINSIIFEKIIEENEIYRNYIPKYKGSSISYIKNNTWNYNDLIYTNDESPYSYKGMNINNKLTKVTLFMSEAIDNIIGVGDIIYNYVKYNGSKELSILVKVSKHLFNLYKFIETIGLKYGFTHNDLHLNNIVYDNTNDRLLLIDFGRSCFIKYIKEKNIDMNNCILSEYCKLNYNEFPLLGKINSYNDLFDKYYNININNKYDIDNKHYFGVIYDLITYTLTIYYNFCIINTIIKIPDEIRNIFDEILKINNGLYNNIIIKTNTRTINILIKQYNLCKENIEKIKEKEKKNNLNFLSDGLFYMALYIYYKKIDTKQILIYFNNWDIGKNLYIYHNFVVIINKDYDFINYIQDTLINKSSYEDNTKIKKYNSFIKILINNPPKSISKMKGGLSDIKKAKKAKKAKLSLEETTALYEAYFKSKL